MLDVPRGRSISRRYRLSLLPRGRAPTLAAMRRLLVFLSALALLVGVARPARAQLSRPIFERRLANGLRVVVCPDPAGSDVSLVVRYDVGSRDEPTSLEGLAHLVEHVMFTGSKHVPRGKLAELLEQAGATNVNAATSMDATVYHETLPPERLELGLWLESDRMGYLLDSVDEGALRRARGEVLNEYRDRISQVALGAVTLIERTQLFPSWHPYHHLPVGTREALEHGITLADAQAFAATWYGPGNALVVIAGKVDAPAAMELVERYFGSLPARPPPRRPALPALTRTVSTYTHVLAAVTRAEVRIAWATPAYGTPEDAALDVASVMLTGRGAGWLNQVLMIQQGICSNVGSEQESSALSSVFAIRATLAEGHKPREVLEAIQHALARFDTGVTEAEVVRAQRMWHHGHLFGLETSMGWAGRLALDASFGPLPARYDGHLGHQAAVQPQDVRAAVRTWLARRPAVYMISHPDKAYPISGRASATSDFAP